MLRTGSRATPPARPPVSDEELAKFDLAKFDNCVVVTIPAFSGIERRHTTSKFRCADLEWELNIFPSGNENGNYLAVFLGVPNDNADLPRDVRFQLAVLDQKDMRRSVFKEATHIFTDAGGDWGFNTMVLLADLVRSNHGFVLNDEIHVMVFVDVLHKFSRSVADSREKTGFVGMRNQGATCYLNSLLQSYFHIGKFRKLVYEIESLGDQGADDKNMCLALQRVFWRLQLSQFPVETDRLTQSFGWTSREAFMQHDAQELNAVLIDKLQTKLKGTAKEGEIETLLIGRVVKYIRCLDVDFESRREQDMVEIQLNVKRCPDIMTAIARYCEEERLVGDNQYNAEGHGMQDAIMGTKFGRLPPVLQLHLMRYDYDPEADAMVKINDRFEFAEEIDLTPFMANPDPDATYTYTLFSVLVHAGDGHGGHYYAFMRPLNGAGQQREWFKFDDEVVTQVAPSEVFEDNFGGQHTRWNPPFPIGHKPTPVTRTASAYMLVYVVKDAVDDILTPRDTDALSPAVTKRFVEEEKADAARRKERDEAHLYTTIKIMTNTHLLAHAHSDMPDLVELPCVKIKTTAPVSELQALVSPLVDVPEESLVFYSTTKYQDHLRISHHIPHSQVVSVLCRFEKTPTCFVDDLRRHADGVDPSNHTLIICKFFDIPNQALVPYGTIFVPSAWRIPEITEKALAHMNKQDMGPALVFEEQGDHTSQLDSDDLCYTGEILVFQPRLQSELPAGVRFDKASKFVMHLANSVVVSFELVKEASAPSGLTLMDGSTVFPEPVSLAEDSDLVELELARDMRYDDVTRALGERVRCPGTHIQLLTQSPGHGDTDMAHTRSDLTLGRMLASCGHTRANKHLRFRVLDVPLADLRLQRILTVTFCSVDCKLSCAHRFLVANNARVERLLALAADLLRSPPSNLPPFGDMGIFQKLQLVVVLQHRISAVHEPSDPITNLYDSYTYRIDCLPGITRSFSFNPFRRSSLEVIQVMHFSLQADQSVRFHGVPFHIAVGQDWTGLRLKREVAQRLKLPVEEVEAWPLAIVVYLQPQYIPDNCLVRSQELALRGVSLEHSCEEVVVKERTKVTDRAVRIYN